MLRIPFLQCHLTIGMRHCYCIARSLKKKVYMYLNKPFMSKEKNSHCINNYLISSKFFYNSVSLNKYFFHFMFHMENGTITKRKCHHNVTTHENSSIWIIFQNKKQKNWKSRKMVRINNRKEIILIFTVCLIF